MLAKRFEEQRCLIVISDGLAIWLSKHAIDF